MANLVPNIAKGRVAELAARVLANDPANSVLVVIPISAGAVTDAQLLDADDFAAMVTLGITERTTGGWNRKTITDASPGFTVTTDDTNDRKNVDIADQTWTTVTAGVVTDLVVCYDNDSTAGTDANLIPLCVIDWAVTPDGSDVVVQWNAEGIYRGA